MFYTGADDDSRMRCLCGKAAVEVMVTRINTDSVGGVSPSIGYRNNSGKTIKYIDFTMVPYNAVGDPVSCTIRGYSSAVGEVTGPIETFAIDTDSTLHTITKIRHERL